MLPALLSLAVLATQGLAWPTSTLVTFGDSYTDQSRRSLPSPDGGTTWVRYAEMYGSLQLYNYAVSGAACSNLLTPRPGAGPPSYPDSNYPSVLEYEMPAFAMDWVPGLQVMPAQPLNPDTTVYSLWIGTNDVGEGSLLTGNQTFGTTIVNVTQCAIEWMSLLYSYGARRFLLQNMIPLQLVPMYSVLPDPDGTFWPQPHNRTDYNIRLQELVMAGNALWDLQVPTALNKMPGAAAAIFNSYALFSDMYNNPGEFLNGTLPYNVTGYVSHGSGANVVNATNPDSYLWWNELHPSEQAQRNVAKEIVLTLNRTSKYARYLGDW
ncbi:hypothetical protein DACRYDRAFT_127575 [Dacryopinax primogenitus]|uniref:Carbohydrate esterase family 16 protein n=1 Tax=Dacryopinax primogenitus (strain DJM 731) TaxID=1858805 RepID=M5G2M2_DACPD|nr:uncharacterized protein DACRYDRAFT_127575 [Dacryopinax primogenitus]EJT98012.1 hypothetical protein DACRYDRAFT_127575 [Dacryopinax primogenitus]